MGSVAIQEASAFQPSRLYEQAVDAFSKQRYDAAERLLKGAIAQQPNRFEIRFLMGATLVSMNRNTEAIEHLKAAHKLKPAHLDCVKLLAAEYLGQAQPADALRVLQPLLPKRPDEELLLLAIEARHVRGDVGDAEEAMRLSTLGVSRYPKSPRLLAWRGFALRDAGALSESRKALEAALKLAPGDIASKAMLADVRRQEGDTQNALALFDEVLSRAPDDEEALVGKARTLSAMGKLDAAIETLQTAVNVSPGAARLHLHLSQLYATRGDSQSAAREAAEFRRLRGSERDRSIPAGLRSAQ